MADKRKILLSPPCTNGLEQEYISESFAQNWIAPQGPQVTLLENELATYLGGNVFPVVVSSGTAAIHLSLLALGVKATDYVLVQSFTFAASANPVKYLGATPVFVDSEEDTWNMSPKYLEKAIVSLAEKGIKPAVIITVALYGMPYKMEELHAIAAKYNIPVLEDSAEALGSTYNNKFCGTFGALGVFSFNGNKIVTMTSGGAVICKSQEMANHIRFLANQAKDNVPYYQHTQLGFNYAQSSVLAAIGRAQLSKLSTFVIARRQIHEFYKQLFVSISYVEVFAEPNEQYVANHWLTCIVIKENGLGKTNTGLKDYLHEQGIESRYLWKPMHLQPLYCMYPYFGDGVSEYLFNNGLCLPSGSGLTQADLTYIKQNILAYFTR